MTGLKIFIQLSLLFGHLYKITGVNHQLRLNLIFYLAHHLSNLNLIHMKKLGLKQVMYFKGIDSNRNGNKVPMSDSTVHGPVLRTVVSMTHSKRQTHRYSYLNYKFHNMRLILICKTLLFLNMCVCMHVC